MTAITGDRGSFRFVSLPVADDYALKLELGESSGFHIRGPSNKHDPNYNSPKLYELSVSYEKELFTDFAARIEGFYKRTTNQAWTYGLFADGTQEYVSWINHEIIQLTLNYSWTRLKSRDTLATLEIRSMSLISMHIALIPTKNHG